ncbi:hypothetical protein EFT49_05560 [Leuconostoc falkenbergense]|uniref:hypothetical protein n=1 Tax=Leuconostoc falkenbergense TaxID=2766470 RepID=UPI0021AABE3B|nr:hypothetical protein [Leuconostoc falkenbergense]MCT4419683.1 hypothetical protein [Leuconostoc falkenbergense]
MLDKWDWKVELAKAHLTQADVGRHLGFANPGQINGLVTKMILASGKGATAYEQSKWKKALDFIKLNQHKHTKENDA